MFGNVNSLAAILMESISLFETDHKPLLSLLRTKHLDDLPPQLHRFRMRLMRYSYKVSHVPCCNYLQPLTFCPCVTNADATFVKYTNIYLAQIEKSLPASNSRLDKIQQKLKRDPICNQVMRFHEQGWPKRVHVNDNFRPYCLERHYFCSGWTAAKRYEVDYPCLTAKFNPATHSPGTPRNREMSPRSKTFCVVARTEHTVENNGAAV